MLDILKAIIFGIVEGITEWLPISSTGHLIIMEELLKLDQGDAFFEMFQVVIQLGAILAVVVLYFHKLNPFSPTKTQKQKLMTWQIWIKVVIGCLPAGVIGILFDDVFNALFYNYQTVSIMLILFGILFLIIENRNRYMVPRVRSIAAISYGTAFLIGVFQLIAAVFPGTSRSGATIVGALLLGVSRTTAAEFTFFLAIPAMFGGSAIKLLKTGLHFSASEFGLLVLGMAVAFVVSIFAIRFLMSYIKKHDFKVFGWYRIVLGVIVLIYFAVSSI